MVIKGMLTNLANTQSTFWLEVGGEIGLKKGRNKSDVFICFMREKEREANKK